MHYARLSFAFLAAAVVGAFVACGTTTPAKCSPANCQGCCDAAGACQTGGSQSECGSQGNGCVSCAAGTNCEFGICRTSSTTGGGGGSTGGGGGSTGGGTGGGTTGGGTGGGSTGGGTGGGATGGGGGTFDAGTFDAGTVIRPDGGSLNPPTIPLTFMANCGSVTPCAGNEVDAWDYASGCIDDSAFSRVTAAAAQYCSGTTVTNKNGAIAGSVVFDGTVVHRVVVGQVNFTLTAGGPCGNATVCSAIPGQAARFGVTGTCAVVGAICQCALTFDIGQNGTQNYTYVGGVLTTQGPVETYDTCITGNTLRYRQTDGGIPGVFSLTK